MGRYSLHPSICPLVRPSIDQKRVWLDGWTEGETDKRREFFPLLRDFVPSQGRCPKREEKGPSTVCELWHFVGGAKAFRGFRQFLSVPEFLLESNFNFPAHEWIEVSSNRRLEARINFPKCQDRQKVSSRTSYQSVSFTTSTTQSAVFQDICPFRLTLSRYTFVYF